MTAPLIYNLFPLLAGPFKDWGSHLERARRMGFNWVFVNPFHLPGASGSLYAVKDHYGFHPLLLDPDGGDPAGQLRGVVDLAHGLGLKMMMDLVINHTAVDSPLAKRHINWYRRDDHGKVIRPGAWDNGKWVTWGDLGSIDNAGSPDRNGLWQYWRGLVAYYAGIGFDGFRCDAAYQVPQELWRYLIGTAKECWPRLQFFAESLGCTIEQTLELARAGFDFTFNSSKWWDFSEPWCLKQYRESAPVIPSISFPESHDTERLAAELGGHREAVRQRFVFAAFFATGLLVPMGFEYGFRRRLHVVQTRPSDWEEPSWDDTEFIAQANALKGRHEVWQQEGPVDTLDAGNERVLALYKSSRDGHQRGLLLVNKDRHAEQRFRLGGLREQLGGEPMEVFPESRPLPATEPWESTLPPTGIRILMGT